MEMKAMVEESFEDYKADKRLEVNAKGLTNEAPDELTHKVTGGLHEGGL